jgi:hypothetical protein
MKKAVTMMVAGMITSFSFAQKIQEKNVPTAVKNSFNKIYPSAKEVKWEKEKDNYEVSFDANKVDNSVLFDADGKVVETEVEIELNQLPSGVLEYVKTHYSNQKVKEAAKITDAKGTLTYEAELKGMDVLFDSTGNFIKEVKD